MFEGGRVQGWRVVALETVVLTCYFERELPGPAPEMPSETEPPEDPVTLSKGWDCGIWVVMGERVSAEESWFG